MDLSCPVYARFETTQGVVSLNIESWFQQASDQEIHQLLDQPPWRAERVVNFFNLELVPPHQVYIEIDQVMLWIYHHRPDLYAVTKEEVKTI